MNTDFAYKNLVLAGAKIVEDLITINSADFEIFENGEHLSEALKYLINVASDILTEKDVDCEMARIYFADIISVYAHDEVLGETYYDLFWKMISGEDGAVEKFEAISDSIPKEIECWVRRNI